MKAIEKTWWKERVFYQIYPLSFRDSNGDGLGDLRGIIEKLPYLRDLGIGGVWICPFYDSPLEYDYGYGPADLYRINPLFGTMDDFCELLNEAHRLDIKVLLEWAATNTSIHGPWFKESRASRNNPKADWYHWYDDIPNNWVSYSGGSAWHYCPERNQYYLGLFFKEHAELNWRNAGVRRAVLDAFEFWVNKGIDGFRIDTIDMYVKDRDFRDNPRLELDTRKYLHPSDPVHDSLYVKRVIPEYLQYEHIHDRGQPETMDIMREMRARCDRHGRELFLIGEVDIQTDAGCELCMNGMSVAFNFSLARSAWGAASFYRALKAEIEQLNSYFCCNTFSNHDARRAITRFGTGDYAEDLKRAKVLAALTMTLKGVPMLYYGEEIGMPDVDLSYYELKDPISKNNWDIGTLRETGRGPMQWDAGRNAGFSRGKPWMKMSPTSREVTVQNQEADRSSMLSFYKKLISLRNASQVLQYGDFTLLGNEPEEVLAYRRALDSEAWNIFLNFTSGTVEISLREYGIDTGVTDPIMKLHGQRAIAGGRLSLEPYGIAILKS